MTRKHYPAWLRRRRHGAADEHAMEELATAMVSHEEDALRALLHPEVILLIDSGGLIPRAATPIEGRVAAAGELSTLATPGVSAAPASINGVPGLLLIRGQQVIGAITAEVRSGMLTSVWAVCNPEKLRRWNRR